MRTNSKEWWDAMFVQGWEKEAPGVNGPDQTRYFMDLIIRHCGIDFSGLTILDYGCAMGQGVNELSRVCAKAEGYDISYVAIDKARKAYPELSFHTSTPEKIYDTVICSNVLEHFTMDDLFFYFCELFRRSRRYVITITPYNQVPPSETHPTPILETTFPDKVMGFKRIISKHLPNERPEMCGGDQIMFIWERADNAFFTTTDEEKHNIRGFNIPVEWWSRIYEYIWCAKEIVPGGIAIDAGCGVGHPFKYFLADQSKMVYAVDSDPDLIKAKTHERIIPMVADMAKIELSDNCVDTVFCISVLEHLDSDKAVECLQEFNRVLKPGGKAVVTMDVGLNGDARYSWILNPSQFFNLVPRGFVYKEFEEETPKNTVQEVTYGLCCYHAVLTKEG